MTVSFTTAVLSTLYPHSYGAVLFRGTFRTGDFGESSRTCKMGRQCSLTSLSVVVKKSVIGCTCHPFFPLSLARGWSIADTPFHSGSPTPNARNGCFLHSEKNSRKGVAGGMMGMQGVEHLLPRSLVGCTSKDKSYIGPNLIQVRQCPWNASRRVCGCGMFQPSIRTTRKKRV